MEYMIKSGLAAALESFSVQVRFGNSVLADVLSILSVVVQNEAILKAVKGAKGTKS